MIYIFESLENNASIVYAEDTLSPQEKAQGLAIESLPEQEAPEGKMGILKVDISEQKVWWEYVDIPEEPEEILEDN